MGNKTRFLTILLIAVLTASPIVFVQAQTLDSIAIPSIPKFTVKVVAHPYEVAPVTTTTIDQYTGKETTTITPGYRVENKSIEVTIKNQAYTAFNLSSHTVCWYSFDHIESYVSNESIAVNHYFMVEVKGHFGNDSDWQYASDPYYFIQGGSENTVITVSLDHYPADALLDFRVSSGTGYVIRYNMKLNLIFGTEFFGQKSDWSNIHTLNLTDNVETVIPNTATALDRPSTATPAPLQNTTDPTPDPTLTAEPTYNTTSTQQIQQTGILSDFDWQKIDVALVSIIVLLALATFIVYNRRKVGNSRPEVLR
jgi:hypothetical protein